MADDDDLHAERTRLTRAIVDSQSPLKVIVAGPGTGKTHTFREVLDDRGGGGLALTFINNLVADLATGLAGLADAQTLHGQARAILHNVGAFGVTKGCDYYPSFAVLLAGDAAATLGQRVTTWDVEGVLHEMDEGNEILSAALASGSYYDAVGHTDAVYRVVRYLRDAPEVVPAFSQLVVDEFQDFSRLEVAFVNILAEKSPTLLAGDDDQALYEFKHARADYLRDVAQGGQYELFELPYCSRCTSVLVGAAALTVQGAQASGLLADRIDKRYECFTPTKAPDSARYPKITHAACSVERNKSPYMGRYIAERIGAIPAEDVVAADEGGYPTVLIIGPPQFAKRVHAHLEAQGTPNLGPMKEKARGLDPLDGYRRLAGNPNSRLGWRILLEVFDPGNRDQSIRDALGGPEIRDCLPLAYVTEHLIIADLVRRLINDQPLDGEETALLERTLGASVADALERLGRSDAVEDGNAHVEGAPSIRVTTLEGSKGLQAAHVFVVGLVEGHFPKSNANVDEHEVCCMLVALTRATKSCTLVTCGRFGREAVEPAVFLEWLDDCLERQIVDAAYFRNRGH